MAGRPSGLTEAVQQTIVEALELGVPREMAFADAHISRAVFYKWMARGREEKTGRYVEFVDAVENAEAKAVGVYVKIIHKAAPTSWQAAAWMLERRFPDQFARKDRISIEALKRTEAESVARELGLDPDEVLAAADAILSRGE